MNNPGLDQQIAQMVTTAAVFDLACRMDCSMLTARQDLEAEAYAAITGKPVDYSIDWRHPASDERQDL